MDHFNATIKDGKLIKTRRGLQVSRQRFNGLSFVNASPHDPCGSGSSTVPEATGSPSPRREIKFVEEGTGAGNEAPEIHRRDVETPELSDASQGSRRRRRAARRERSPVISRAGTPPQPSATPLEEQRFQIEDPGLYQNILRTDPNLDSLAMDTPADDLPEPDPCSFEDNWALFERQFDHTLRCLYPFEDILTYNPVRTGEFYTMVTGDGAAVHCVRMCGSISEAIISSEPRPDCVAYHISKICAMLNQKLNQAQGADAATMHCIATLAWTGCYVGRLDHWQLHMSGLRKVLDLNGGLSGLPPWLLAEIYTADLKGATALALSPCLPFVRSYDPSPVSDVVSLDVRKQTSVSLSALLSQLHIDPEIIASLISLSILTSAVRLAYQYVGTVAFEPHAFTEEWQAIMHALLAQPVPLRAEEPDPGASNPYSTQISSPFPTDTPASPVGRYARNHRLLASIPILPSTALGPGGHFEPALRVAALLCLKELLPDWPRNLGGYSVLLGLLRQHLAEIIRRHGSSGDGGETNPLAGRATAVTTQPQLSLDTTSNIDPRLTVAGKASPPSPSSPNRRAVKAVAIFLCLVGDRLSQIGDANERRLSEDERYPRDVYHDCLTDVAGLVDEGDVDALGEEELILVRLFHLGTVFGHRNGEGDENENAWDWSEALRHIIAGRQ
ncbi:uncharacterized protein B0T15DRAFT_308337 [Chaetomium strumarium]|uniref:Uncharacterized protein n=1 Tax=Chaetomium strumarium TaxID=1170767 RepID=A0AAJ0GM60_9PEZI|nr:hypothetical protein B0T15DRAFT_308337 [Chaetomium strumarium]